MDFNVNRCGEIKLEKKQNDNSNHEKNKATFDGEDSYNGTQTKNEHVILKSRMNPGVRFFDDKILVIEIQQEKKEYDYYDFGDDIYNGILKEMIQQEKNNGSRYRFCDNN